VTEEQNRKIALWAVLVPSALMLLIMFAIIFPIWMADTFRYPANYVDPEAAAVAAMQSATIRRVTDHGSSLW
jgi:hypothetical protein